MDRCVRIRCADEDCSGRDGGECATTSSLSVQRGSFLNAERSHRCVRGGGKPRPSTSVFQRKQHERGGCAWAMGHDRSADQLTRVAEFIISLAADPIFPEHLLSSRDISCKLLRLPGFALSRVADFIISLQLMLLFRDNGVDDPKSTRLLRRQGGHREARPATHEDAVARKSGGVLRFAA